MTLSAWVLSCLCAHVLAFVWVLLPSHADAHVQRRSATPASAAAPGPLSPFAMAPASILPPESPSAAAAAAQPSLSPFAMAQVQMQTPSSRLHITYHLQHAPFTVSLFGLSCSMKCDVGSAELHLPSQPIL